jgi:antitoxin HigA-1
MRMYDPTHPGDILRGLWLEPMGVSVSEAARALGVSRKTLSKFINGRGAVTAEMAVRLELCFGASAESWLAHQAAYQLWQMEARRPELHVERLVVRDAA